MQLKVVFMGSLKSISNVLTATLFLLFPIISSRLIGLSSALGLEQRHLERRQSVHSVHKIYSIKLRQKQTVDMMKTYQ